MNLGTAAHIVRGVTDFEETLDFYKNMGYSLLEENDKPNNFALFTDGIVNLLISEDQMTYTGLIYFGKEVKDKVRELESMGIEFFWKEEREDGTINQAMFEVIPEKFGINLVNHEYDSDHIPDGDTVVDFGKFGEFSIPVKQFDEIEEKLNKIGFETKGKYSEPYNWGILSDGLITVGLHETEDFTENTLTYFHPSMEKKIDHFENQGFGFQKMGPENAKVTAPDGLPIFLFKGEI